METVMRNSWIKIQYQSCLSCMFFFCSILLVPFCIALCCFVFLFVSYLRLPTSRIKSGQANDMDRIQFAFTSTRRVLVDPVAELGHTSKHRKALSCLTSRGAPAHRALQYPAASGVLAHVWSTTITMTTAQDLSLHSSAQHLVGYLSRRTSWYWNE